MKETTEHVWRPRTEFVGVQETLCSMIGFYASHLTISDNRFLFLSNGRRFRTRINSLRAPVWVGSLLHKHSIVTAYSWATISHLSANIRLEPISRQIQTLDHNGRTLTVQGGAKEFNSVFNGFGFPSLAALWLSCLDRGTTTLRGAYVHQAITRELHLQFCVPFDVTHFLLQP